MKRGKLFVFLVVLTIIFLLSGCQGEIEKKIPLKPSSSPSYQAPTFPIALETTASAAFKFAVFGDNRPENPEDPQPKIFKKLVKMMTKEKLDLILSTGDMVTGKTNDKNLYRKQYLEFLNIIKSGGIPFFGAVGNHDASNKVGEELYQELISPKLYFSFDYKNSHFIVLNTDKVTEEGIIGKEQLAWLKRDLIENQNDSHIFVFMHRPVLSVMNPEGKRWKHLSFTNKENEKEVKRLFEKYGVDVVFEGHEHFFNKQTQNGVIYIITGCAGSAPYADAKHGGFPHFVLVNVNGEKFNLTVINSRGKKINPDSIPKPKF